MNPDLKLLLLSNSYAYNGDYLQHCKIEIKDFLNDKKTVLFIPYALSDRDEYTKKASKFFNSLGIEIRSIHMAQNPQKAVVDAEAIMIGGGNTFRLLNELYKEKLIDLLREKIFDGTSYIGSSAGTNISAPTIKTTNDWPIVQTPSLNALELVPFQINPHFVDADANTKHMGETREERIKQFHEENDIPVLGLREGAWLRIENGFIKLGGKNGAKLFYKGKVPIDFKSESILTFPK